MIGVGGEKEEEKQETNGGSIIPTQAQEEDTHKVQQQLDFLSGGRVVVELFLSFFLSVLFPSYKWLPYSFISIAKI